MTLKKFLILPLLVSIALFVYYSSAVQSSSRTLHEQITVTSSFVAVVLLAVALQIGGHLVRAKKAELLFEPVKDNTTRFQFRALSVGYLFNTLLPFKLGELIRARIIAGGLDLSFGFALALIIIERAFDAAILGLIGLILLAAFNFGSPVVWYIAGLLSVSAVIGLVVVIVVRWNNGLLKVIYRFTDLFKETIKNALRFKSWSVIYGLQRTLKPRLLIKYLGLSLLSWTLYASSVLVLAAYLMPHLKVGERLLAAVAPYFGFGLPSGPASLGVFSDITDSFTKPLGISSDDALIFNLVAWAVLIIPIASLGIVLLFVKTKETLWRRIPQQASALSLENKLSRTEDISQEMARFLENYFSGNSLSHIVHKLELQQNFRLLKYFKGGSDAITILALQDGKEVVKKIIPAEFEDRLKAQYDWLAERKNLPGIVEVLREEKGKNYYAIDLAYDARDTMLFDYMHQNPLQDSEKVLEQSWKYLAKHVHGKPGKLQLHSEERQKYIDKHIFGCLEKAAKVNPELLRAAEPPEIIINGHTYDNLYQIMDKIKKHPQAWKDIATYRETPVVHGDMALDNILIRGENGKPLLIDPAPDGNIISGPVFDFGKNMQSLYCGYEFSLRDESPVYLVNGNNIQYREHSSAQYNKLCDYVRQTLAPQYLGKSEQKAIIFHAGALHIRRLKHQVYYNPSDVLKFYAVGVKTFNDFLAQYE